MLLRNPQLIYFSKAPNIDGFCNLFGGITFSEYTTFQIFKSSCTDPPAGDAMTEVPSARASIKTFGNPSNSENKSNASAFLMAG